MKTFIRKQLSILSDILKDERTSGIVVTPVKAHKSRILLYEKISNETQRKSSSR